MTFVRRCAAGALHIKNAFLFATVAALISVASPAHATVDEAKAFVEDLANQTLAILQDENASPQERRQKFAKLFQEGADLERIGRFVLGRYANQMRAENRLQEYQALFREYVVNIYAARLGQYSGETFEIVGAEATSEKEAVVQSKIRSGEADFRVNWRVLNSGQGYKVVDVQVEGIWMAIEQREQFTSFINNNNRQVSALIDYLRDEVRPT